MKSFVDTNILVYAEDRDAGARHERSRVLVERLWESGKGVLSLQVLQEYFVTVTRKLSRPMDRRTALEAVEQYLAWHVVEPDGAMLLSAIQLADKNRLSFWDALVVQAALEGGCAVLYTEDLNHGQRFDSLEIRNPFLGP